MDPLLTSLLDLHFEIREHELPLTVGGGFGLFLKRLHLASTGERTLFDRLPQPRATNDVDLFIRAEILADVGRTREIAEAIRRLHYQVVDDAKYLQWTKDVVISGVTQQVKLDLLVGPLGEFRDRLHVKAPRARPKGDVKLHAHCVEEALRIDDGPMPVIVEGSRTGGEAYRGTVFVPRAFPYLMMKLHAFDDRKDDDEKDVGRHHALDLYTIVGMMTEGEYDEARELGRSYAAEPHVERARRIVAEQFGGVTLLGLLRLREHLLFRPDFAVDEFVEVLGEVFRG